MHPVQVWRGAFGDPAPLFGPLPGVRSGQVIAYEFALPERFEPRPGRTRLERAYVLTDVGVGMAVPCWLTARTAGGEVVRGVDAAVTGEGTTWYVDLLQVTERENEIIIRDLYIDVMVPTDGRHHRLLDLDEFADAIDQGRMTIDVAVDALRRWQSFLDTYLYGGRDPRAGWSDFPPRAIAALEALPGPLGPVVTWRG